MERPALSRLPEAFPPGQLRSRTARSGNCVGVKGLVLDTDFAANHLGGGGVFPDTIFTETAIDWRDLDPTYRDNLSTYVGGDFGTFLLQPGANVLSFWASGGVVPATTTISVCWYVEFIGR